MNFKRELTNTEKITLLLIAKEEIRTGKSYSICNSLAEAYNKQTSIFRKFILRKYRIIDLFPELLYYKPINLSTKQLWFDANKNGNQIRINVIDEMIYKFSK